MNIKNIKNIIKKIFVAITLILIAKGELYLNKLHEGNIQGTWKMYSVNFGVELIATKKDYKMVFKEDVLEEEGTKTYTNTITGKVNPLSRKLTIEKQTNKLNIKKPFFFYKKDGDTVELTPGDGSSKKPLVLYKTSD